MRTKRESCSTVLSRDTEKGAWVPEEGAVFVLPVTTSGQQGPVAAWLSTAGWADATTRVLGDSWIVTPEGFVDSETLRRRGSDPQLSGTGASPARRSIPLSVKTAIKDVRQWRRARAFTIPEPFPWEGRRIRFVWQRHELFHRAGLDLAARLGVPSVVFVPAPLVWEAKQWGVRRPGWAGLTERIGEKRALVRADLVLCGSEVVADQVRRIGVSEHRVVITPTGVDPARFRGHDRSRVRADLGIGAQFTIGWVGSFRRFHALEHLVSSAAALDPGVCLLLVGDGPERARVESMCRDLGVPAVFTGTVPSERVPAYLEGMDAAVIVASGDQAFHYSPLKLAEYMASGRAVIAPRIEQISRRLCDGEDALLYDPGDSHDLQGKLELLRSTPVLRERLGARARDAAVRSWSWDEQVRRVVRELNHIDGR